MSGEPTQTPLWSSKLAFYLSAVGGAVGLGSIWRFPYLAGTSGGSAFIFVFVLCCLLIAIPLVTAEFAIGRRARVSPPQALGVVAAASKLPRPRLWNVVGILGTIATFLIMSYYSVVAGWVLAYTWKTVAGQLVGLGHEQVLALWRDFLASPWQVGGWHLAFLALVTYLSARGVGRGIEMTNKFRAPALLVLLLILVAYALATGDVARGLAFAFTPNFAAITPEVVLAAVGQAFFATGVGMAMMLALGSYATRGTSLARSSLIIIASVLLVSILSAVMIFPLVFSYGMNPAGGVVLVFDVLVTVFAEMPAGRLVGTLFFLLLVLGALTPSLAGIEPIVAWLQQRHRLSRPWAAVATIFACWVVGIGSVLSYNLWADFYPLDSLPVFSGKKVFDIKDYVASNILLPIGAFLVSIFFGWRLSRAFVAEDLQETTPFGRQVIVWLLRYLCPLAIAVVFATNLF